MDGRVGELQFPALPDALRRYIPVEEDIREESESGFSSHRGFTASAANCQTLRPGVLVDSRDDIHRPGALVVTERRHDRTIAGSAPHATKRERATSR